MECGKFRDSDHNGGSAIAWGLGNGDEESGFHVGDGMLSEGAGKDRIHMFSDVNLFLKICNK